MKHLIKRAYAAGGEERASADSTCVFASEPVHLFVFESTRHRNSAVHEQKRQRRMPATPVTYAQYPAEGTGSCGGFCSVSERQASWTLKMERPRGAKANFGQREPGGLLSSFPRMANENEG
jgi:hypothetical protein